MVSLGWGSPTNQTGLLSNKAEMLLRAYAFWFADGENALIDPCGQQLAESDILLLDGMVGRSGGRAFGPELSSADL